MLKIRIESYNWLYGKDGTKTYKVPERQITN
jgi:hypothetical protein